jgi:hypothetical protein
MKRLRRWYKLASIFHSPWQSEAMMGKLAASASLRVLFFRSSHRGQTLKILLLICIYRQDRNASPLQHQCAHGRVLVDTCYLYMRTRLQWSWVLEPWAASQATMRNSPTYSSQETDRGAKQMMKSNCSIVHGESCSETI